MFDMLQGRLQRSGLLKKELEVSTSWEGRFNPAGLTKSHIRVLLARPASVNRPSQLALFARASSACRGFKQKSLLTCEGIGFEFTTS